jgi:type I restriction enzyme S subunit
VSEYPSDWDVIELGRIGTWLSGGTPSTANPAYWDGEIPWISAASLKSMEIFDSDRKVSELGARSGTSRVPPGTIVFVVRGMSLKSEFRVGITAREVTFGQDCKAILAGPGVNPRFLVYCLKAKQNEILVMVDEAGHGTGRLPTRQLANLRIGVPAESEQRRIVAVLDSVDESIRSVERFIAKLECLRKEFLGGALGAGLGGLAAGWRSVKLGELLDGRPRNGYSPKPSSSFSGVYMLGLGCLTANGFSATQLKYAPDGDPLIGRAMLAEGDLLISRANTRELVGMVGRYEDVGSPCIYPDLMMRLRVGGEVRAEFLELVLRSDHCRRQIQARASGTSESMVKISSEVVMDLAVRVPPLDVQLRIVEKYEALTVAVDSARSERVKLCALRWALANDLLTGQKRIGVDAII